jgi:hypothetical protein
VEPRQYEQLAEGTEIVVSPPVRVVAGFDNLGGRGMRSILESTNAADAPMLQAFGETAATWPTVIVTDLFRISNPVGHRWPPLVWDGRLHELSLLLDPSAGAALLRLFYPTLTLAASKGDWRQLST